jgi:hypothetical protein
MKANDKQRALKTTTGEAENMIFTENEHEAMAKVKYKDFIFYFNAYK